MVLCSDGHTSAKLFFWGGDWWRSYWGTLASCCWLSFAVVCFKRKCGLLFFPLGECLQSGQAHKVDTREIVYSFFGDNPATRPQFSQPIDQRTFQLERQGLLLMRLYFIRTGRFHQQMCAHTHTYGGLVCFILKAGPDLWCWRHVPSALIRRVVRRRSRPTFLWLCCHCNTNNFYVRKFFWLNLNL